MILTKFDPKYFAVWLTEQFVTVGFMTEVLLCLIHVVM